MPIRYMTPDSHPVGLMVQSPYLAELDNDSQTATTTAFTIIRPTVAAASRKTTVSEGPDGRKWFELSGITRLCISVTGPTTNYGTLPGTDAQATNYDAIGFRLKVEDLNDLNGVHLSLVAALRSTNGATAWYSIDTVNTTWLQSYITSVGEYYVEVKQYRVTAAANARPGLSYLYYEIWIDGVQVLTTVIGRNDYSVDINWHFVPVIRLTASNSKLKFRDVYAAAQLPNSTFKTARSLNIKTKAYRAEAISGYPNDLTEISNNLANGAVNTRHDTVVANTLPTQMIGLGGQVDLTLDHVPERLRGTPIPVFRYGRVSGVDTAVEVKSLVDSSVLSSVTNTPTPGAVVGAVNLSPATIDPAAAKLKKVRVKFTQFVGGA